MALDLAKAVLRDLFPGVGDEGLRTHPDIHWLFPEMKSRIVSVESVHSKFIDPMEQTAYSGGWKVGVLVGADRLNAAGANASRTGCSQTERNSTVPRWVRSSNLNGRNHATSSASGENRHCRCIPAMPSQYSALIVPFSRYPESGIGVKFKYHPPRSTQ